MVFQVKADLVRLLRGLVDSMQPFAEAHQVALSFESQDAEVIAFYQPEGIIPNITRLLTRIIAFTPQLHRVQACLESPGEQELRLNVINTGANLERVREITSGIQFKTQVSSLEKDGTHFRLYLPVSKQKGQPDEKSEDSRSGSDIPAFYAMMQRRLTTHFRNIERLEAAADHKGDQEGVFLKKINAIILSHLDQREFKAEALARASALSRTQLHRKIKILTAMSPGRYLQFVRLQKAKQLLETRNFNVSEVAYLVGFVSNSHFTRAFQKEFGFRPSDFK